MKIDAIIERAAKILWRHKILAALGILDIVLTSSELFARAVNGLLIQGMFSWSPEVRQIYEPYLSYLPTPIIDLGQLGAFYRLMQPYGAAGWAVLITAALAILIALAVAGLAIEGGMIAVTGRGDEVGPVGLGGVLGAGWRRILPMVVIASVPAIPATLGAIVMVAAATGVIQSVGGLAAMSANPTLALQVWGGLLILTLVIFTPLSLVTLPLELLTAMAYRACMLENLAVMASFRRAWGVLRGHMGLSLVLVIVGYGISVAANIVAYLPNLLVNLFLPAIVLIWLIRGVARAYYVIVWTVGWRSFTTETPPEQAAPPAS